VAKIESSGSLYNFPKELGKAVATWAEAHPTPDKRCNYFFNEYGEQIALTPIEYARHINAQTRFGKKRIEYYLAISSYPGPDRDLSGKLRVDGYLTIAAKFKKDANASSGPRMADE